MAEISVIKIEANDCSVFSNQEKHSKAIQHFISENKKQNIFHFSADKKEDELEFATFNTYDCKWYAGRLVGESTFVYNEQEYKIVIKPRFGNLHLFKMLEEIFNIRLSKTNNAFEKQSDYNFLIKKLISYMWLNALSKANKHGLPHETISKTYKGTQIKGRIDIRKTVIPLYTEQVLVSHYRERRKNEVIVQILNQAYKLLSSKYHLNNIKQSRSAKNAIEQLKESYTFAKTVTKLNYESIQYKSINKEFKSVVDLSWDILQNKHFGNTSKKQAESTSFFIDMAEVWELYLRSILKKHFSVRGWSLRNDKIVTYKQKCFQRKLIPDIVLEKDNKVMVWDAKYKRMKFKYYDYDRADFFQIHTYMSYYQQTKNVIAGGLLYPISETFDNEFQRKNKSDTLFSAASTNTAFVVDGIDYTDLSEEKIKIEELNFLNRISSLTKNGNL